MRPRQILLLYKMHNKPLDYEMPFYLIDSFGDGWKKEVDLFIREGLLRKSTFAENVGYCKVSELKEFLTLHGLKKTGNKGVLVSTILQNFCGEQLSKLFPNGRYVITDSGRNILDKNKVYIERQNLNYPISNAEIELEWQKLGESATSNDIFLSIFTREKTNSWNRADYNSYRSNCYFIGSIYMRNKDYSGALEQYLRAFHVQIAGMINGNRVEEYSTLFISNGLINDILQCAMELGLSPNDIGTKYLDAIREITLPFSYYSVEQQSIILPRLLNGQPLDEAVEGLTRNRPIEGSQDYLYYDLNRIRAEYSQIKKEETKKISLLKRLKERIGRWLLDKG